MIGEFSKPASPIVYPVMISEFSVDADSQNDKRILNIPIDEQIQTNVNSLTTICETFCEKYEAVDPLREIIPNDGNEVVEEDSFVDSSMMETQMALSKAKRRAKRKPRTPKKSETDGAEGGALNEEGDPLSPDAAEHMKREKLNRRRSTWSEAEKHALMEGYQRHGGSYDKWRKIQSDPDFREILADRTNIDLKDKYRNIQLSMASKMGFIPPDQPQHQQLESAPEGEQFEGHNLEVQYEVQLGEQSGMDGEGGQMDVPIVVPVPVKTTTPRHKDGDVPWTEEEKQALLQGYERYGSTSSKWRRIQSDPDFSEILYRRTNVDLKDKYRNIRLSSSKDGRGRSKKSKTGDEGASGEPSYHELGPMQGMMEATEGMGLSLMEPGPAFISSSREDGEQYEPPHLQEQEGEGEQQMGDSGEVNLNSAVLQVGEADGAAQQEMADGEQPPIQSVVAKARRGRKKKVVTDQAAELASKEEAAAFAMEAEAPSMAEAPAASTEEAAEDEPLFAETHYAVKEEIEAAEAASQQQGEESPAKEQPVAEGEHAVKRRRKMK
mmetsp:Transcript_26984/g.37204  ORF Transcript_26984/g.37204 Transcript_26984/m.37204 type:complete len:551 (-) Transcript_26984:1477-3129(-)